MMSPRKFARHIIHYARWYGLYWVYPMRQRWQPRRFQAFSVGVPKSGTHSINGLFERHYRSVHEPESETLVNLMPKRQDGRIDETYLLHFFRRRDKYLWLEMESSNPTGYFSDVLAQAFPEAKFILTIRDCYSWLDSYLNQQLGMPIYPNVNDFWNIMRRVYYSHGHNKHDPAEKILADHRLYTLDGYLSFWQAHNKRVLEAIPPERLLVIRTPEIGHSIEKIANFLEIPVDTLDQSKSHLSKTKRKFGVLPQIDRDFLEAKVERHCRPLMAQFFPEISSLSDIMS